MLFLAHTWLLKEFLTRESTSCPDPDIFIHNLAPDILTIHQAINPGTTHGISRFQRLPARYKKAAFAQFHLLADDMAHYGEITDASRDTFDPDSQGYCYLRGKALLGAIRDFYSGLGQDISYSNAAYRSHIIIEMALDLILHQEDGNNKLLELFREALRYTVRYKIDEFSETAAWLFGIGRETISEAMHHALDACTSPAPSSFMHTEDRAGLYIKKFCLDRDDAYTREGVTNLLKQGVTFVPDYRNFLLNTVATIKKVGFASPL